MLIEDIGLGSQGRNKIFIQESLTPARRELFHKKKCKLPMDLFRDDREQIQQVA